MGLWGVPECENHRSGIWEEIRLHLKSCFSQKSTLRTHMSLDLDPDNRVKRAERTVNSKVGAQRSLWSRWTLKPGGDHWVRPLPGLNHSLLETDTRSLPLLHSKGNSGDKNPCELDGSWLGVPQGMKAGRPQIKGVPSPGDSVSPPSPGFFFFTFPRSYWLMLKNAAAGRIWMKSDPLGIISQHPDSPSHAGGTRQLCAMGKRIDVCVLPLKESPWRNFSSDNDCRIPASRFSILGHGFPVCKLKVPEALLSDFLWSAVPWRSKWGEPQQEPDNCPAREEFSAAAISWVPTRQSDTCMRPGDPRGCGPRKWHETFRCSPFFCVSGSLPPGLWEEGAVLKAKTHSFRARREVRHGRWRAQSLWKRIHWASYLHTSARTENRSRTPREFPRPLETAWEAVGYWVRGWETESKTVWNLKLFSLSWASYPHTAEVKGKQVVQMRQSKTPFTREDDSPRKKHPLDSRPHVQNVRSRELTRSSHQGRPVLCLGCLSVHSPHPPEYHLWLWGFKGREKGEPALDHRALGCCPRGITPILDFLRCFSIGKLR